MTTYALVAAKGSPGVSTWATSLLLAWPAATGRQILLADVDVSGAGPVSAYQRHGLGDGRGLLGWVAAGGLLEEQLFAVDGEHSRWLLPGLPDASGAAAAGRKWSQLQAALEQLCLDRDLDVLVDVGRWGSRHEATELLVGADVVLLVLRSTFESVSLTQAVRTLLPQVPGQRVVALLSGERDPYTAREVARAVGLEVLGVLPFDTRAARRLVMSPTASTQRPRSSMARAAHVAAARMRTIASERADV